MSFVVCFTSGSRDRFVFHLDLLAAIDWLKVAFSLISFFFFTWLPFLSNKLLSLVSYCWFFFFFLNKNGKVKVVEWYLMGRVGWGHDRVHCRHLIHPIAAFYWCWWTSLWMAQWVLRCASADWPRRLMSNALGSSDSLAGDWRWLSDGSWYIGAGWSAGSRSGHLEDQSAIELRLFTCFFHRLWKMRCPTSSSLSATMSTLCTRCKSTPRRVHWRCSSQVIRLLIIRLVTFLCQWKPEKLFLPETSRIEYDSNTSTHTKKTSCRTSLVAGLWRQLIDQFNWRSQTSKRCNGIRQFRQPKRNQVAETTRPPFKRIDAREKKKQVAQPHRQFGSAHQPAPIEFNSQHRQLQSNNHRPTTTNANCQLHIGFSNTRCRGCRTHLKDELVRTSFFFSCSRSTMKNQIPTKKIKKIDLWHWMQGVIKQEEALHAWNSDRNKTLAEFWTFQWTYDVEQTNKTS